MSYLDGVLNVQVSAVARPLRARSFAKPLLLAYDLPWVDLYREFGEATELVTAGVAVSDPVYLMFQAVKAQEPSPPIVGIGRRTRPFTQVMSLVPAAVETGKRYSFTVDGTVVEYVATGGNTIDDVIDGLIVDAGTISGLTIAGNPSAPFTDLRLTGASGVLHSYTDLVNMTVEDVTADPGSGGVAADFAAVLAVNSSWYGVLLDSQSKAEILALAPAVETAKKRFCATTADGTVKAGTASNVALQLQTAGYARTTLQWHHKPMQYFAAAILGRQLPKQPGSTNEAWQAAFAGVDYSTLTDGELTILDTANCNHYTDFAGQGYGVLLYGKASSGVKIDVTTFSDWMRVRMQERLFLLFVNAEKIGATSVGIQLIANEMRAQFKEGVRVGGLSPDFETIFDIPEVDEIPLADLAANTASGFRARHRLAVSIDKVNPMIFTLTL
jgi:hypothetical protein